jgi:hypothetical protein
MRLAWFALALLPALAAASPRPTFDRETAFESCQDITQFACGMRDASGNTFGTAKITRSCSRYTFEPDGSFASNDFMRALRGRYRIVRGEVVVTFDDPSVATFAMKLSPDGAKLGTLSKVR